MQRFWLAFRLKFGSWLTAFAVALAPSISAQDEEVLTPGYYRPDPDEIERDDDSLLYDLVGGPGVVAEDDDSVWFEDKNGERFRVFINDGGDFVMETPIGLCFVDGWLLQDDGIPALGEILREIQEAQPEASGEPKDGIRAHLWWQPLVGHAFVCDYGLYELDTDTLWIAETNEEDRQEERKQLFRTARDLFGAIDEDETLRTVLGNLLSEIVPEDDRPSLFGLSLGIPSDESPDLPRSTLRRLLRHGWLDGAIDEDPTRREKADALVEQLKVTDEFRTVRRFVRWNDGESAPVLQELRDAFGRTIWTKKTDSASHLAVPHRDPELRYNGSGSLSHAFLEYRLPKDAEPLSPSAIRTAEFAELRLWGRQFATFKGGEVSANESSWNNQFSGKDWSVGEHALENPLPPHLALTDARGDLQGLALPDGTLWFDDVRSDPEAFLQRAARFLHSAPQIDLLGQYAFIYASDSPDNNRPELIGTTSSCGDRQSTALETLGRSRGAECRGDCDDYSALCAAILELRGVPVIQFGTPGHVSAVWVEEDSGSATAYLVQTGPTLEFAGTDRLDALARAYRHLDSFRVFDPSYAKAVHHVDDLARPDDVLMPAEAFFDQEQQDLFVATDLLRRRGRYGTATRLLEDYLAKHPENAGALIHHAQYSLRQGDLQAALASARRALALDSDVMRYPSARLRAQILVITAAKNLGQHVLAATTERRLLGDSLMRLADVENPLNRLSTFWEASDSMYDDAELRVWLQLVDATIRTSIEAIAAEIRRREGEDVDSGRFPDTDNSQLRGGLWGYLMGTQGLTMIHDDEATETLTSDLERSFLEHWDEVGFDYWSRWQTEPACAAVFAAMRNADDSQLPERLRSDGPLPRAWAFNEDADYAASARAAFEAGKDWRQPIQTWIASSPEFWQKRIRIALYDETPDLEFIERLNERLARAIHFAQQNEAFNGYRAISAVASQFIAATLLEDEDAMRSAAEELDSISGNLSPLAIPEALGAASRHASDEAYQKALEISAEFTDGELAWAHPWCTLWTGNPDRVQLAIDSALEVAGEAEHEQAALSRALERLRRARAIGGDT